MKQNPVTAIKAKFSNQVHKLLEPNINIKKNDRWKFKNAYNLTNEEKIKIFDEIVELHKLISNELTNYLFKRRFKNKVKKSRILRGWEPKKKTKLIN